jgi:hypothetical protein
MEAVNIQFAPETGSEEEWNEAYARLADYFRSYQLHNRIRRTQLILETLRRAAVAHKADPTRTPTAHSIEQARLMMREWLAAIYSDMNLSESQLGRRAGWVFTSAVARHAGRIFFWIKTTCQRTCGRPCARRSVPLAPA